MAGEKILIVEDEALIALMLEDFVEALGYELAGAVDSIESGLAAVQKGGVDAVILDVNLRDHTASWPLADALAEADIPFLFTSGGDLAEVPAAHENRHFLSKPFSLERVGEALNTILQD